MIILRQKNYSKFLSKLGSASKGFLKGAAIGAAISSPVSLGMFANNHPKRALVNTGIVATTTGAIGAKWGWDKKNNELKSEELKKDFENHRGELIEKYYKEISEYNKLVKFCEEVNKNLGPFSKYLEKQNKNLGEFWEQEAWGWIEHICICDPISLYEFVTILKECNGEEILSIDYRYDDIQHSFDIYYDKGFWISNLYEHNNKKKYKNFAELKSDLAKFIKYNPKYEYWAAEDALREFNYVSDVEECGCDSDEDFKKKYNEILKYKEKYHNEIIKILNRIL